MKTKVPPPPTSDLRPPTSSVTVLLGPVRSGKTYDLVRHYRSALEQSPPANLGRALWLAPNGRTAAAIRDELVRSGLTACLRANVLTFEDLTDQVLATANNRSKPIDAVLQRELVRRVIESATANGALKFFAGAADRPGFVGLVASHITELKRRNIRPDAYRKAAARSTNPLEQKELAALYADYESLLTTHALLDRESAHDAARDALAKNGCPRFQNLTLVVADGFTDFTSAQHEIFRLLAETSEQLMISLPTDAGSARPELFAKTEATFQALQHNFPQLELRTFDRRALPKPSIDHVTRFIFANPKQIPAPPTPLDAPPPIEIIASASVQDEITQIARRIKSMLAGRSSNSPSKPGDILVVFRSLTSAAPRLREVFDRFGIPYFLEATPPIITAPAIKTLLDLLQLDQDDWPFRRVVSVLTNNFIGAFNAEARRAAEWLVRDLQVASGRDTLLGRTEAFVADPTPPNERSDHLRHRAAAATLALPALQQLAKALHELPKQATPKEWCEALARLSANLGLAPFSDDDTAAWKSSFAHFTALERLDGWLDQPPQKLDRAKLITTLRDVATGASLPTTQSEAGRVRILSATAARNISARHLFLAGMSEQAFPSPEAAGRLATDADYHYLAEATRGRKAPSTAPVPTLAQAEMLLFYEIVSRAEDSLTISYPALDDKAQALPPSPYVVELERLFAHDPTRYITRTAPQLSPVASIDTAYSVADWRTQAVALATKTDGNRHPLADIFSSSDTQPLAAALAAGLQIVHARARGESFGPAEGLLTSPAIAARLAQRFGPKHTWSASQWETYATCPFRFFMQHVLKLEALGDLVLETDYARRGSRLHDVLAKFHRDWLALRTEREFGEPDEEAAAFLAHLQQVAHDRKLGSRSEGIDAALHELDHRQILKWSKRHFEHQSKYVDACKKLGPRMTPTHFEFRFGPDRRGDGLADPDSTDKTFTIDIDGEPVKITGQIDRIDVATVEGQTVFNVIDYKSGRSAKFKRDELLVGQQLQLPIYVEAAQALVFKGNATPLQAGYWSMGAGYDAKGALTDKLGEEKPTGGWQDTQNIVHGLIREFIQNIRRGDFPVESLDDECTSTCDYRTTCRVAQARSLHKTQQPTL